MTSVQEQNIFTLLTDSVPCDDDDDDDEDEIILKKKGSVDHNYGCLFYVINILMYTNSQYIYIYIYMYVYIRGVWGGVEVKALRY